VASLDAVVSSVYGRLLLAKLVLVTVALATAATTALAVHPRLGPVALRRAVGDLPLRRVLWVEAAAVLAVLGASAAIGSAQPAVGSAWAAPSVPQPLVSATAADLVETLQVAPNQPGRNFVTLDAFDTRRPAPAPVTAVTLHLTGPTGERAETAATQQGDGHWLVPTDVFTVPGPWTVRVDVSRPGIGVTSEDFDWVVADPGAPTRHPAASTRPIAPALDEVAAGLAVLLLVGTAAAIARQTRGRRRVISAPPSGADPATATPPEASTTAATSASPSPLPGSMPGGWR